MCDWSVTADVRWKNQRGQYEEYMGGCCHDEVAKHFPELAKFISLHLCNHYGAPMYPVRNGIYHVRRSGMSVAAMHRGAEFRHGLVEDVTGHQWSLNRYENDLLTAGCHRIAYNEMERIAKQLGWV